MVDNLGNEEVKGFKEPTMPPLPHEEKPVAGLPMKGYKPTQRPEAIAAVNRFKDLEEYTLREMEKLSEAGGAVSIDARWLNIGRTQLQQAFMAINRAIFQPERVHFTTDPISPADLEAACAEVPDRRPENDVGYNPEAQEPPSTATE